MANNKNDQVVIALFDSEDFANYGIDLLKKWDYATEEVKLGSIGTISMKGGKVKTHVPHKTGGGAKVGAVVGLIAAVLTGGTSWIVGAIGGSALGGITGAFFKKSLHLTKQEIEALGKQLENGKVAVVVTCDEHEVEATRKQLAQYGGTLTSYAVPEEALTEAADALADTGIATEVEQPEEMVMAQQAATTPVQPEEVPTEQSLAQAEAQVEASSDTETKAS
jgi:hypothetical protein